MSRTDRLVQAVRTGALSLPGRGDILVMRAASSALAEIVDPARLVFETAFRPSHDALVAAGLRVTPRASAPAAMVVITLGRARAENLGDVARALALLAPGDLLALDGAKTDGIDSLARHIAEALPLGGDFAKAHGRVVWLARPDTLPPEVAAWAAAAAPSRNPAGFVTAPGMFSSDGPDPGSLRLAATFDGKLKGRVADLGAGWGWLAIEALARSPKISSIDLYEADAGSLEAARANLSDPRADFHWADVAALGRANPPFDAVIANPPFHHGRAADPALGAAFIAAAGRLLKPSGRLLMVANRQLPYEAALDAAFLRVDRLSQDGAFKLFAAERPRRR